MLWRFRERYTTLKPSETCCRSLLENCCSWQAGKIHLPPARHTQRAGLTQIAIRALVAVEIFSSQRHFGVWAPLCDCAMPCLLTSEYEAEKENVFLQRVGMICVNTHYHAPGPGSSSPGGCWSDIISIAAHCSASGQVRRFRSQWSHSEGNAVFESCGYYDLFF